ncbi:MAG: serpin family protein [Candidatus Melainabacteria bacterium]|nr:serpin family protein [Candidatus Melainabacteria bacterium]
MNLSLALAALTLSLANPLSAALADDVTQLSKDHTAFALSLYPTLNASDGNLVFSPYSIATCLSMVYVGARGDTESQMEKALHLEVDRKDLGKASFALSQTLQPQKNGYKMNIANALWVDQATFLLTNFRSMIEGQFKAKLGVLDFSQTQDAMSTINTWASDQTEGKIKDLLQENDINGQTRLVLTNAVYFQGAWANAFDPKKTANAPFFATPDASTNVPMMQKLLTIPYYENDLMQAAALPFQGNATSGGRLALLILLPKSADNFATMYDELNTSLPNWITSLDTQRVDLKLPKFCLNNRFAPIAMNANHPFLFFIVDLKSQELLFMGKMAQP